MPPKPRRVQVDGTEMVVLTGSAYESLAGQRRQAGAQAARVRALRTQLDQLISFVDRLDSLVAALPGCPPALCSTCLPTGAGCARDALVAELARRPRTGNHTD
ncbi:hypothetical protein AB0I60_02430 [Actinosynnema sp. NPDC050436]|uniref:hypothetical protein n=1 Tax=Actinosynnema sp. NPDC050436 TaxID=3155659 RepID=UPI0033CEABAF